MTNPPLDERSREVLKSIIQLHVSTGEPVGSEKSSETLGCARASSGFNANASRAVCSARSYSPES